MNPIPLRYCAVCNILKNKGPILLINENYRRCPLRSRRIDYFHPQHLFNFVFHQLTSSRADSGRCGMTRFRFQQVEGDALLYYPYSTQISAQYVGEVTQKLYGFLPKVFIGRFHLHVVLPGFLLHTQVFRFNCRMSLHLPISLFVSIIVHSRDGFLVTAVDFLVTTLLSSDVPFHLYHYLRWFRRNYDQHAFWKLYCSLKAVGHEDINGRPVTFYAKPFARRENCRFTICGCLETYDRLAAEALTHTFPVGNVTVGQIYRAFDLFVSVCCCLRLLRPLGNII